MNAIFSIRQGSSPCRQQGFSLIEVLVAVLVLGVGLLGLAALQLTALRNNQSAFERSQGVVNTYSILDAMRANLNSALAGDYELKRTCKVPKVGLGGAISAAQAQANSDKQRWMLALQQNLGGDACGSISCKERICKVSVEWSDERAKGGSSKHNFETEVRL